MTDVATAAVPAPKLWLALYQPDIPQNAGTMLRGCACLGVGAAIIEPAGFPLSDKHFRRAGMDYLDALAIERHISFNAFERWRRAARQQIGAHRLVLLSTKATMLYTDFEFHRGDILMVGRESAGVPETVRALVDAEIRIAMRPPMRSLNVAVAAFMVIGEALRQIERNERQQEA